MPVSRGGGRDMLRWDRSARTLLRTPLNRLALILFRKTVVQLSGICARKGNHATFDSDLPAFIAIDVAFRPRTWGRDGPHRHGAGSGRARHGGRTECGGV